MKIKEKDKYYFHKNLSHEDYPFKELSHNEIEAFIKENIIFKDKRFQYRDFIIPTCWRDGKPIVYENHINIQIGKNKCMALGFSNNKSFYFIHDLKYNIYNLKMMILYKK